MENYKKNKYQINTTFLIFMSIILICTIPSCKDGNDNDKRIGDPILLSGSSFMMNFDLFSDTFAALIDSNVYMNASIGDRDSLITVYQMKGDSLIAKRKLIGQGTGPFEGFTITTLYDVETHRLFFFENHGMLRDGYLIDVNDSTDIYNTALWKKLDFSRIQNHRIGHSYTCLNDTLILAIGGVYDIPAILTVINLENQETIPVQFWINDDDTNDNIHVKQAVCMNEAEIYYNKKLDKCLYICGSGRYMELFQMKNYSAVNRKVIENIFPKYEVEQDTYNYHYQRDFKYRGFKISVTDSYIYTKREEYTSNRDFSLQSYKGYPFHYNDIIDVYDWDGNWIKYYQLDMPFCDLLVDPEKNVIYVTTIDLNTDKSLIRKYQIH
jgi:hypothetical protein